LGCRSGSVTELAIVMAGGRSTRMRATSGSLHKAMIEIAGVSLIERNVRQLLGFGFRDLAVVVSAAENELHEFVLTQIAAIAVESSARLRVFVETVPLGNIGFIETIEHVDDVIVTYVDNLTGIDIRTLLAHHRRTGNDLTIAAHAEPVSLPYGVLEIRDDVVVGYDEKPLKRFMVSSGTCVVGRRARDLMPHGLRLDARDLFRLCSDAHAAIGAYVHTAPWVDVNDAAAAQRATALVRLHTDFAQATVAS
jgi:NDP-mannose synthase